MTRSRVRAALRIARRDAWSHKWRSLLVIALIGLPVFALAGADIVYRTWQLSPTEKITRVLGSADAAVMAECGGPVKQSPQGWLGSGGSECDGTDNPPDLAVLRRSLPAGSHIVEQVTAELQLHIKTKIGLKDTEAIGFDYADPAVHGLVRQVHGRAPRSASEIALTTSLAASTGLQVGDVMQTIGPKKSFTVVGIVQDAAHRHDTIAYQPSSTAKAVDPAEQQPWATIWYIKTTAPMDWTAVRKLNAIGFVVTSKSVYLNPPPKSQVDYKPATGGGITATAVATGSLIAGMALLEIVLLAGPAFAVSAKRHRRDLALIAATGGERRDLRNVVLANGVVLGLAAGAGAVAGALALTAIGIPIFGGSVDQPAGHFDVRPLELLTLGLVSTLTALLAALVPAYQAARTDVVAALGGRRGVVRTRRWIPVLGIAVTAVGVVIAVFGLASSSKSTSILAGVAVTEFGLIICTPSVLGAASHVGRWLPLAPRIALRDAGRNRSSAAPAVAAIMASMIGAVAILIGVNSAQDQDRRNYFPSLPGTDAFVTMQLGAPGSGTETPEQVAAIMRSVLPTAHVVTVHAPNNACANLQPGANATCTQKAITTDHTATARPTRYRGGDFPEVLVDDGSAVDALFGTSVPEARAALRAGRVVVPDSSMVHGGKVTLVIQTETVTFAASPPPTDTPPPRTIEVDATVVDRGYAAAAVIIPPSIAKQVDGEEAYGVLADTSSVPTDKQQQVLRGALQNLDPTLQLQVESGYHDPSQWKLYALIAVAAAIALGAAITSTLLADVDAHADLLTLGAVGASPRTRRLMSMSRAGVISSMGCVVGVVAGFVPAYAWARASRVPSYSGASFYQGGSPSAQLHFVVPWLPIVIALIGVPLIAALLAGVVTRSRLPVERAAD